MNKRVLVKKIAYIASILILSLVMIYSGLQILESTVFSFGKTNTAAETGKRKTITVDGVDYYPRQDITVIMVLGIDQDGPVAASDSYNNDRQADMVALILCDEKNQQIRLLNVNRDTMVEMPVLGIDGRQAGTTVAQLTLAHTYGSGLHDSCENMKRVVSDFFRGLQIDYYVAMNMDAVTVLNDAVGGVAVNITDDFSAVDPDLTQGNFILRGDQAKTFVRSRRNIGDHLNLNRIERQKEYMSAFVETFRNKTKENETFFLSSYEKIAPYLVSDLPVSTLSGMIERYADYGMSDILTLEGENVQGEEFYEFYPDPEKLEELTLQLFYAPK